jgi:hypothetical protein
MKFWGILALVFLSFGANVWAQSSADDHYITEVEENDFLSQADVARLRHAQKKWYVTLGLGKAFMGYHREALDYATHVNKFSNYSRTQIDLDLAAYYDVHKQQTMVGYTFTTAFDIFSHKSEWVRFQSYLSAISVQHYPFSTIGEGFFMRLDLGFNWLTIVQSNKSTFTMETGPAFATGLGYGLWVKPNIGVNLTGKFQFGRIEEGYVRKFAVNLGVLY